MRRSPRWLSACNALRPAIGCERLQLQWPSRQSIKRLIRAHSEEQILRPNSITERVVLQLATMSLSAISVFFLRLISAVVWIAFIDKCSGSEDRVDEASKHMQKYRHSLLLGLVTTNCIIPIRSPTRFWADESATSLRLFFYSQDRSIWAFTQLFEICITFNRACGRPHAWRGGTQIVTVLSVQMNPNYANCCANTLSICTCSIS